MGDSVQPKADTSPSAFHGLEHGKGNEKSWHSKYGGTLADQADMEALGRKQELRVWNFTSMDKNPKLSDLTDADEAKFSIYFYCRLWLYSDRHMGGDSDVCPSLLLSETAGSPTDQAFSLLEQGLTDGGTAGLIWSFVVVAIGFLLVFLSLAEMASM